MAETENKEYDNYRKSIEIGLQLGYLTEIKKTETVPLREKEEIIRFYKLNNSLTNGLPQLIDFYRNNSETLEKLARKYAGHLIGSKPWEHKHEFYEFINEFARRFKETDLFKNAQNNPELNKRTETIENFVEEHLPRLIVFQTEIYNVCNNTVTGYYKQEESQN